MLFASLHSSRDTCFRQSAIETFTLEGADISNFYFDVNLRHFFHLTKESAPVVAFGGVGMIVGDLSAGQALDQGSAVVVILPRYGFIRNDTFLRRFSFCYGGKLLKGQLSMLTQANTTYVFISAPSHCSQLWRSSHSENIYDIPKSCRRMGFEVDDRDLYYSMVAAQIVGNCRDLHSLWSHCDPRNSVGVHIHSAHNSPAALFLRSKRFDAQLAILYVMHDYNNEPYVFYVSRKLYYYIPMSEVVCVHADAPQAWEIAAVTTHKVAASEMIACADLIVLVSRGMLTDLLQSSPQTAQLLRQFKAHRRLVSIGNWVTKPTWTNARRYVRLEDPTRGKLHARTIVFNQLVPLARHASDIGRPECLVLWIGRFDINKGIAAIPQLIRASCNANCAFAVMGYSPNLRIARQLRHQLNHAAAKEVCPIYSLDIHEQRQYGMLLRAAADVVTITSATEAYGLVVAEALAYGSIPVVSAVGGMPEIVVPFTEMTRKTWTGIVFEFRPNDWVFDVRSASDALMHALSLLREQTPEELDQLRKRSIVSTRTSDHGLNEYRSCIESVLNDAKSSSHTLTLDIGCKSL